MSTKNAVIIGASAPDTVKLIHAINRSGNEEIVIEGFLDDDPAKHGTDFMGYPVLGPTRLLDGKLRDVYVINNVARDTRTRQLVACRFASRRHLTLIHPTVDCTHSAIGIGCIIQEGVVLGADTALGNHCVLYAGCVIGHETAVGDLVFVANKAIVGARTKVGSGVFVGLGSIILPYATVGAWATIGAGAVVIRNVDPGSTVFGNPARAGVRPVRIAAEVS